VATRRRRAAEEPLDVRLRSREPVVDLEVRNPIHRTSYRVLFPEFPLRDSALCTCTDFARRGLGTCKHLEAGWSWLQELPELPEAPVAAPTDRPPGELWKEIDRRLDRLGRSAPARIREVEKAGAPLYEQGTFPEDEEREGGEKVGRPGTGRPPPRTTSRARA
jgi:hypothetical protein